MPTHKSLALLSQLQDSVATASLFIQGYILKKKFIKIIFNVILKCLKSSIT